MNTGIFWTFGLFFMPLRVNQTENPFERVNSGSTMNKAMAQKKYGVNLTQFGFEERERSELQKQKIIQNLGNLISQRIAIKNLHLNHKEYKKYLRKRVKCGTFKFKWVQFRNSILKNNSFLNVKMNSFELSVIRFMIVSLFFVHWIVIAQLYTVAIFHQSLISRMVFWVMMLYPNMLTQFYTIWNHLCYVRISTPFENLLTYFSSSTLTMSSILCSVERVFFPVSKKHNG
jgi:hypothetical protein